MCRKPTRNTRKSRAKQSQRNHASRKAAAVRKSKQGYRAVLGSKRKLAADEARA